ncbi:MAG: RidA family protein [Blastocatellia bacterium]|jgi:2-iminobutanoate/2-iminopropanoate deaminase|nr:RidA family protein [Blastocatellia bacterium]
MRERIHTNDAPKAIGPYSQAIRAAGLLFVSGQIALDPQTGETLDGDVAAQTERLMTSATAILEAGGASMSTVVKTTVYLTDMAHFTQMNEVYGRYFESDPPARSTVAVAALPRNVLVEIDFVAIATSERRKD